MTREEAQISLAKLKRYMSGGGVVDRKANEALDMAIKALEESKRKKGCWNVIQGDIVVCSICGMRTCERLTGRLIKHFEPYRSNFCPNCGADMKG